MDWAHLFMPNSSSSARAGSIDADQPLLDPNSDFFESFLSSSAPIPPRPPSVPLDLEPAPLFSPALNSTTAPETSEAVSFLPPSTNTLGLQFGTTNTRQPDTQASTQPQFSFLAPPSLPTAPEASAITPVGALFDSGEEAYLNSFLSSFDVDGLDSTPYVGSPPPMANLSSRADFASMGMGMGMGIGAGVMGAMDDAIPHLSLEDKAHDSARGLSHMAMPSNSRNPLSGPAAASVQPPASFFEYGLGGTSHLSLGNVMNEEMHKVSSWLLQNQQQSPLPSSMPNADMLQRNLATSVGNISGSNQQFMSGLAQNLHLPSYSGGTEGQSSFEQHPPPVSESDLSVKRKASHEQIDHPRKTRGNVFSPGRDIDVLPLLKHSTTADTAQMLSPRTPTTPSTQRRASTATTNKRRDSKKSQQRTVLTEEERRANHIASEQRRRNQIRQGYAELMSLVTTLQDPSLGNHPGTAQSTPSKAVILTHAIQFIRSLEEGNQILRKRLEDTQHGLNLPSSLSQIPPAFRPQSPVSK
ncbi:hypothetical protein BX667DRAFT_71560 [Coemansia mojavensis]|nr:hypothetical protein BX667DRAFT_71560 [Coemansia mojavensis]